MESRKNQSKPPLLFVHGAWHGKWYWEEYFVPYFEKLGYTCHTFDLRGHGKGGKNKKVRFKRIGQYVEDLRNEVMKLETPPILIGHSMGTLVTQKYLEKADVPLAFLLAPVPPYGVYKTMFKIMFRHPLSFLLANLSLSLHPIVTSPGRYKKMFYHPDIDQGRFEKYNEWKQSESYFAFLGMLMTSLPKTKKVKTPIKVLGAEKDYIFSVKDVENTAKAYNTEAVIFEGVAHNMMLDDQWEKVAEMIDKMIKETL